MALRNQPYIPLYVQDFMTDEKLMECSASATGVYVRIMCVMHKSKDYGTILLKQNDKQTNNIANNFALKLAKFLPYPIEVILSGLEELLNEDVLCISGDILSQKRMLKDAVLSDKRSLAGSKGGKKTTTKKQNFAKANTQATSEIENEIENEDVIKNEVLNESEYVKLLMEHGFEKKLIIEWFVIRNKKNVSNTTTFFKSFIQEVNNSGKDANEILKICVENSWAGFKVEWLNNLNNNKNGKSTSKKTESIYSQEFISGTFKDLQS